MAFWHFDLRVIRNNSWQPVRSWWTKRLVRPFIKLM